MSSNTPTQLFPDVQLIAIYNFKGGVGKTTTAQNLSRTFSDVANSKVLLVDVDAQCNLSSLLNANVRKIEAQIEHSSTGESVEIPESLIRESTENLMKLWVDYINEVHTEKMISISKLIKYETYKDGNIVFIPGTHSLYDIEQWHNVRKEELRDRFKFVRMILEFAHDIGCKHVLVDLNPGDSLLNRTILFRSNVIVTPASLLYQ